MKSLDSLLVCFLVSIQLYSQNCNTFEDKKVLTSIRFGNPIPNELMACSRYAGVLNSHASVRIHYDSLSQSCKKKLANDFTFLSTPFSFLQLGVNKKGLLYSVELYSFFDDSRPTDSLTYRPPWNFIRVYKELVSLFGRPNSTKIPTREDTLFVKELGMPLILDWECNNITLRLRVVYGARNKDLNVLHVQIIDRAFDLPEVEQRLSP